MSAPTRHAIDTWSTYVQFRFNCDLFSGPVIGSTHGTDIFINL